MTTDAGLSQCATASTGTRRRIAAAIELASVVGLLLFDYWFLRDTNNPRAHAIVFVSAGVVVANRLRRRYRTGTAVEHDVAAPARAWRDATVATTLLAAFLIVSGWALQDDSRTSVFAYEPASAGDRLFWVAERALGALMQQIGLQLFIWPISRELFRTRRAAMWFAAAVFATIHLPNPLLVVLSFIAGFLWLALFARNQRLAPLAASHAIVTIVASGVLPNAWIEDLRIGEPALQDLRRFELMCSPDLQAIYQSTTSPEYYRASGGNDREFVNRLYLDLLERSPRPRELVRRQHQLGHLTRDEVVRRVIVSDEFRQVRQRRGVESIAAGPRSTSHK